MLVYQEKLYIYGNLLIIMHFYYVILIKDHNIVLKLNLIQLHVNQIKIEKIYIINVKLYKK